MRRMHYTINPQRFQNMRLHLLKDRKEKSENMRNRKAAFFDIDGTIWNKDNIIPESTREAIRAIRANGHLAFLCSGRCRSYIQNPELLGIGFDGVVSGCGTMIEYGNETLFYRKLDTELVEHTIRTVRQYGFRPILEGREYLYLDESEFGEDYYGRKLKAEMGDKLLSISGEWGKWEVSKFSCAMEEKGQEECFAALEEYYDFMVHNSQVVELVPRGYHKGTGLIKVCELLSINQADTFAFGDSVNDIGMLKAAGTAVVMGNGSEAAKAEADYVTAPLMEDGIWKACRHFGLL